MANYGVLKFDSFSLDCPVNSPSRAFAIRNTSLWFITGIQNNSTHATFTHNQGFLGSVTFSQPKHHIDLTLGDGPVVVGPGQDGVGVGLYTAAQPDAGPHPGGDQLLLQADHGGHHHLQHDPPRHGGRHPVTGDAEVSPRVPPGHAGQADQLLVHHHVQVTSWQL